jgi:hypothetical protein
VDTKAQPLPNITATTYVITRYYTEAPKYYTIEAPEYYTITNAALKYYSAPSYTTKIPEYYTNTYAAPTYYTEVPKYYSVLSYFLHRWLK